MAGKRIIQSLIRLVLGEPSARLQRMIFREARHVFTLQQPDFPDSLRLPTAFGRRMPERVVEILLAKQTYTPDAHVLDVGHSNIMECHRRLLASLTPPRHITGIDIATPDYDTSSFYEQSIIADITSTGLPSGSFDIIWCISTMEHIGKDNSGYTKNFNAGEGMEAAAMREMARLLRAGGRLLITVPFGLYEDHVWFRNYDAASWRQLLAALPSGFSIHELFFGYDPHLGWRQTDHRHLSSTRYHENSNAGASGLAAALIVADVLPPATKQR